MHEPFRQNFEQQSLCAVHELPAVRHEPFSGTHFPAAQFPPQQSAEIVHAWLSDVQTLAPHDPPLHTRVQQSCGIVHPLPGALHAPTDAAQILVTGSQLAVQQSPPVAQVSPTSLHVLAPPVPVPVFIDPPALLPPAPGDPESLSKPPAPAGPEMASTPEEPHPNVQRAKPKTATVTPVISLVTFDLPMNGSMLTPDVASREIQDGSTLRRESTAPFTARVGILP
jgi:hypothetical protein